MSREIVHLNIGKSLIPYQNMKLPSGERLLCRIQERVGSVCQVALTSRGRSISEYEVAFIVTIGRLLVVFLKRKTFIIVRFT